MPRAPVTIGLVGATLLAFLAALAAGAPLAGGDPELLIRLGGNFAPLTTGGEWWRLGTALFLHAGLVHLGFNMIALYQAGSVVERLFGSAAFALVYAGAGLAGGAASLWWRQDTVSVGASGAVFGVYGALVAYLSIGHLREAPGMLRQFRASALLFVGYSLAFGFIAPGIDNAAHLGGLVGGALLGAGFARSGGPVPRRHPWRLAAALAALAALAGALIAAAPESAAEYARERALDRAIDRLADEDRALSALLAELPVRQRDGGPGPAETVEQLETRLIPRWDAAVDGLAGPPLQNAARESVRRQLIRYASLRRDALRLLAAAIRDDDRALALRARRVHEEALRLAEALGRHGERAAAQAAGEPRPPE